MFPQGVELGGCSTGGATHSRIGNHNQVPWWKKAVLMNLSTKFAAKNLTMQVYTWEVQMYPAVQLHSKTMVHHL